MKHTFYYFFHTCLFLCVTLTACTAKRSAIKAVSESETASVTESRLTFYRSIDSLSRQLTLSFDSAMIWMPEFPTAFPSGIEGCAETPSDSLAILKKHNARQRLRNASRSATASRHSQVPSNLLRPPGPVALKIYGLHIAENSEEKTVAKADLKDSVTAVTQSRKDKSSTKQSSKPSSTPKYIFYILVLGLVLYIIYRHR
jgi:hypothetical protein